MTIVVPCAVRKILSGESLMIDEMIAASRYYNALVSIERWRRSEYSRIRSEAVPGLAEIDAAHQQLDEWIGEHAGPKGERGAVREKRRKASAPKDKGEKPTPTKRVDVTEELDAIAELKAWRKEAGAIARPMRSSFDAIVAPAHEEYARRSKSLRGLWGAKDTDRHAKRRSDIMARESMLAEEQWSAPWRALARLDIAVDELTTWVKSARLLMPGTYYAIQRRDLPAALKRPPPRPDGEPRRPKMRPAFSPRRRRRIGWELGGITWGALLDGGHSDVTVVSHREQGRNQRIVLSLRLRAEDRERLQSDPTFYRPIHEGPWRVDVDVVTRRKIPRDTVVTWAWLVPEERTPGKWGYSVQFTLEPTAPLVQRAVGTGTARMDLRWTQDGDTLIVADILGAPELRLPIGVVSRLQQAEEIRGYAARHFDVAVAELRSRAEYLPPSVRAACDGLGSWRAEWRVHAIARAAADHARRDKIQALWHQWRERRLTDHKDLLADVATVTDWCASLGEEPVAFALWLTLVSKKLRHLEQYGAGLRRHAMGQRREFYRVTAARMSERYERIEIGGAVDLAALALRDKAEDKPSELHQAARHNRQLAALHELKDALKAAFGPDRYRERSGGDKSPGSSRDGRKDAVNDVSGDGTEAA